jgi:hypothetical protein
MIFSEAVEALKQKKPIQAPAHYSWCGNYITRKTYRNYKVFMKNINSISNKDKESNDWKIEDN